jgi:peptidoglycan/LPS O-acetylase OafA/YrhL
VAVLSYHGGRDWARGGFLGVDAFFVLSGYLITSLLLIEWRQRSDIGLLAFWARRARRLLPALFLMLCGVAFYATFLATRQELGQIRGDALATIGYVANWRPVFTGQSYFERFTIPSPLRHTWSLGIEEQYYIVWPLLLVFLLSVRRISMKTLLITTAVLAVASALLMGILFVPDADPSRVYYGTDTRAQSLLTGATLAMLLLRFGPVRDPVAGRVLQLVGLQCALVIGFLWVTTSENNIFLYRGGFLFLALAVAVVIAAAVQPKAGTVARVLSVPPLRALGLISYGVYLWHWPVYLMLTPARIGLGGYELFGLRVVVTLMVATASYHLVEMPVRRGAFRHWRASWTLAPAGALGVAAVAVVATIGAVAPAGTYSLDPMPEIDETANPPPTRILVVGDSVGQSLGPGLRIVGREEDWNLVVWDRAIPACGFLDVDEEVDVRGGKLTRKQAELCSGWRATWQEDLERFDPDIVLFVFGGMDGNDRLVDGVMLPLGTPEWDAFVMDGLNKQLNILSSQGAKLILATFPYVRPALWALDSHADELEAEAFQRVSALNRVYRQFAVQHPDKVVLVDLNLFSCPEGKFSNAVVSGVKLREDGIHFTTPGSVVVAEWLAPQFKAALGTMGPEP